MSAISQPSVSMRIDSSRPSCGTHVYDSVGTSPASTRGVITAACTKPASGTSAATRNARGPIRRTSHGSASGKTANAARSKSKLAS